MKTIEWMYMGYAAASVAMTVWVARTLHKNGRVFLVDALRGNTELADSVNHLLVVGFYLVNLGFVSLFLKYNREVGGVREAIEVFSGKFGTVLVVLGIMHFFNLLVLSLVRSHRRRGLPPPVPVAV